MLTEMSQNWWLFLLPGLVAIMFGVLALIQTTQAWLALVVLFGVFALLDGIFTLVAGILSLPLVYMAWGMISNQAV